MKEFNLKYPAIVLVICFSIGFGVDYFTETHWFPVGLMILFALLLNGVAISIEDHESGGWDCVENESEQDKKGFTKMVRIQALCTIVVFILGLLSFHYTSS